jgi:hypothetical protein
MYINVGDEIMNNPTIEHVEHKTKADDDDTVIPFIN